MGGDETSAVRTEDRVSHLLVATFTILCLAIVPLPRAMANQSAKKGVRQPAGAQGATVVEPREMRLAKAGSADLVLRGGFPVERLVIPVPPAWKKASVKLWLKWRSSALLSPRSVLSVEVDGTPWATTALKGRRGLLVVTTPPLQVPDHHLSITFLARLYTMNDPCPPPNAPGAFVALDPSSKLLVAGIEPKPTPPLEDLPEGLVERLGDSIPALNIALPWPPSANEIKAAAVVAGAVSIHNGFPGTPVRVFDLSRPLPAEGNLVRVWERPGPASVAIRRRGAGDLELSVSGTDKGVVQAGWALSDSSRAALLGGTHSAVVTQAIQISRAGPSDEVVIVPLPQARVAGTDQHAIQLPFRVPEEALARDPVQLHLDVAYDSPSGGRLVIAVNGRELGARSLEREGKTRLEVDLQLKADDLKAGDNSVQLSAEMPAAAAGRCIPLDVAPSLSVGPGSRISFHKVARPRVPSLGLWPFPFSASAAWSGSAVVLPAEPSRREVTAMLQALAEASRWSGGPLLPQVVVGDRSGPLDRNLLMLARANQKPQGLPIEVDVPPRNGLLAADQVGRHVVIVAFGPKALRPFGLGFYLGRVTGQVVMVKGDGSFEVIKRAPSASMPLRSWQWSAIVLAALAAILLLAGLVRVRRRLRVRASQPAPAPATAVVPPATVAPDEPGTEADYGARPDLALEMWRRLSRQEEEGEGESRRREE